MFDPQKDESQYRHPWRNEEDESLNTDPKIQKDLIINQIANILRKRKKKGDQAQEIEEE
ncbi:MAG: hypothetical protein GYA36_20045 [Veillonellaceae bacterium]|nr:hypothetical protein [Veillonellaceae bacterium]